MSKLMISVVAVVAAVAVAMGCAAEPDAGVSGEDGKGDWWWGEEPYPEYDRIWADRTLRVVAVFYPFDVYERSENDHGYAQYRRFISQMRDEFAGYQLQQADAVLSTYPQFEKTWLRATMDDGRMIDISAFFVSDLVEDPALVDRYAQTSRNADVLIYAGHSGSRKLEWMTRYATWSPGEYKIFFFKGCWTAEQDYQLAFERSSDLNASDFEGTLYADVLVNVNTSNAASHRNGPPQLVAALAKQDAPQSWDEILRTFDPSQRTVARGIDDNQYQPEGGCFLFWCN